MATHLMKQAVLKGPHNMQVEMAPVPAPAPGEILVKVHRLGICGSDTHFYEFDTGVIEYPLTQGHEMSGEVADANGSAVFKDGDKVIVIPQTFCGVCDDCKAGHTQWCKDNKIAGVFSPGMACEYVSFPERMILRFPDEMSYDVAAAIEPFAVAVHACEISGDLAGKNVLVMGAGVIGNFAAQVTNTINAKRVLLAGRKQYRMDFAWQVGIEKLINTDEQDLTEGVLEQFGELPDVIIDFIGVGNSLNDAIKLCRKGGTVVMSGIYGEFVPTDLFTIQDREQSVIGTMTYTLDDFKKSIELANTDKVSLAPLVTDHFTLEAYNEAYEFMAAKSSPYMKVMIDIV